MFDLTVFAKPSFFPENPTVSDIPESTWNIVLRSHERTGAKSIEVIEINVDPDGWVSLLTKGSDD